MPHVQYASWDICYKQHKFKISCYHSIVVYCGYRAYHRISKASKVDLGHLCYPFGVCILWIVVWGALITAPVYPIVSNLQIAVGADTSETVIYFQTISVWRTAAHLCNLCISGFMLGSIHIQEYRRSAPQPCSSDDDIAILAIPSALCTYGPFALANDKWKCLDNAVYFSRSTFGFVIVQQHKVMFI